MPDLRLGTGSGKEWVRGFYLLRIIESEGYKDEQQEDIGDPEAKKSDSNQSLEHPNVSVIVLSHPLADGRPSAMMCKQTERCGKGARERQHN